LVSIALSLLACKNVYATDLENVLEIANENIKENFSNGKDNLHSNHLEW